MRRCLALLVLTGFGMPHPPSRAGDPGGRVKAVNLEKVNTGADEDEPFVAPNNLLLYYVSNANKTWDIWGAQRAGATKDWPRGKPLPGLDSPDFDERSPFLFKDGKLYYARNYAPEELKGLKNFDIVHRRGTQAALPMPGLEVSTDKDELHPWLTAGGKEFYFSRKTEAGWVQFVSRGPGSGGFGDVKEVGFGPGFHHATLTPNALTMYLQGPLGKDRWGLFRSKREKVGGAWTKPEALAALNHLEGERGDLSPSLTADGSRLYFASDRPGGKGGLDLWWVSVADLKSAK